MSGPGRGDRQPRPGGRAGCDRQQLAADVPELEPGDRHRAPEPRRATSPRLGTLPVSWDSSGWVPPWPPVARGASRRGAPSAIFPHPFPGVLRAKGAVPDGQEVLGFFAGRTGRGSGTDRCSPAGASFTANALGRVRRGGASGVPRALLPNHAGRALTAEAAARGRREGHCRLRLPHRWLPSPRPLGGDAGHHAAGTWRALGGSAVLAGVDGAPGRCARLRGAARAGRGS